MKIKVTIFFCLLIAALAFFDITSGQSGSINPNISQNNNERYAWNDLVGWIDFGINVEVTDTQLRGYALSSVGPIALDCDTAPSPPPPDCAGGGQWKVSNAISITGSFANLSGWGWNDQIGWISFCGNPSQGSTLVGSTWYCPSTPTYQLKINISAGSSQGHFVGWAWNDVIGWISFNCSNDSDPFTSGIQSYCGTVDYKVKTTWAPGGPSPPGPPPTSGDLISNIIDTCPSGINCGAAINTIMWQGTLNGGTVRFQIASSNSVNGPWNFVGPNNSTVGYYAPLPNAPVKITNEHNNKRYVRHRVYLDLCLSGCPPDPKPIINDIILNFSP